MRSAAYLFYFMILILVGLTVLYKVANIGEINVSLEKLENRTLPDPLF